MTVKEYLRETFDPNDPYQVRAHVVCADGFRVSIQGGTVAHYCVPRANRNEYERVELGYPSMRDELIMEYAENDKSPTQTVYGYVPIETVERLIEKHGGIVSTTEWRCL